MKAIQSIFNCYLSKTPRQEKSYVPTSMKSLLNESSTPLLKLEGMALFAKDFMIFPSLVNFSTLLSMCKEVALQHSRSSKIITENEFIDHTLEDVMDFSLSLPQVFYSIKYY